MSDPAGDTTAVDPEVQQAITDTAITEAMRAVRGVYGGGAANGNAGIIRTAANAAVIKSALYFGAATGTALRERDERIADLEAALADVLPRFVKGPDGWRARISGTVLDRLKNIADGRPDGG